MIAEICALPEQTHIFIILIAALAQAMFIIFLGKASKSQIQILFKIVTDFILILLRTLTRRK